MKKTGVLICIITCVIAVAVLSAVTVIYKYHKTCYLNLRFSGLTEDAEKPWEAVEASRLEVSHGIKLKGYPEAKQFCTTTITDKQAINKVVDYLNSIPLMFVREGEEDFPSHGGGCSLEFYSENGRLVGGVWINSDNYIWNWATVTTYSLQNKDTSIILSLENLELK